MEPRKLLQALRKRANLSVNMLATRAGVAQSQLQKFESGMTREPRRSTMQPVANYFRVPVEVFYDEDIARQIAQQLRLAPIARTISEPDTGTPQAPAPRLTWPFRRVSYQRLRELSSDAVDDIDRTLDVLVTKWEAELATKKKRHSTR